MKKIFLSIFFLLIVSLLFVKPSFAFFGEKFEPVDGRIIHGLGQYVPSFFNYTNEENWLHAAQYQNAVGHVPVIYSVYIGADPLDKTMNNTNLEDIIVNHGYPYVLLIGLSLHDGAEFIQGRKVVATDKILAGVWDSNFKSIAQRLMALNIPIYLRPGWEFGPDESQYHYIQEAQDFKNIWLHIYSIFKQEGVTNVAWVWNTVNPETFNYLNYYPGDEYVDWWGINLFTTNQMQLSSQFINDATLHRKPVMICESSPIHNGGTTNPSNWNNWFSPYFQKMSNNPHLKAFVYISDPWDKEGFWEDWADSRITSNETIRQNYAQEMNNPKYIHMAEYLANPKVIIGEEPLLTPTPSPSCKGPGDVNCDSAVDAQDVLMVLRNYGKNPSGVSNYHDPLADGKINGLDLGLVIKDWLD